MPTRRRSTRDLSAAASIATRSFALGVAAPQVIAHRLSRMALAGASPSAADRRESALMVSEKMQAFQQAWLAMWTTAATQQLQWAQAAMGAMGQGPAAWAGAAAKLTSAGDWARVIDAGLGPVHAAAVANARRLGRTRTRARR